jgi:DNA-binding CsgD family transcriptional regulator
MALLEREQTIEAVSASLRKAARGEASVLFVAGEPGLGKTSILAECCANAKGFHLAWADCSELEQAIPFGLLDRLLGGLGAPAATLGSFVEGSREARLSRYAGILGWLRSSAPSPLLLAVDNLHWGDLDSVELLSLLCRRLDGLPVAVVATTRPWPSNTLDQVRSLAHDRFAVLERLRPLSDLASGELLETRLGPELREDFVENACHACAGNPLLLSEVADARRRGEDILGGSANTLGERVFLPRFAGVGAPGLRWARAASVLGSRFRPEAVRRLSGQSAPEASEAAEALCAAGLVRGLAGGTAEFVHPLFRQALYDDMAPPTRQGLHASALMTLLEEGAAPAEAAPHAIGAHLKGDPKAVAVLAAAGRQALAAGAAATAAEHFQAALDLAGAFADAGLQLEFARACLLTGKVDLALDCLGRLLGRDDLTDKDRVAGARLQARVLIASARHAEAKQRFEEASDLAARSDVDVAAEIMLDAAFMGHIFEDPREVTATVRRAAGMVRSSPTASQALRKAAFHAEVNLACIGGDPSDLDVMAAAARADLEAHDHTPPRPRPPWGGDLVCGYTGLARISERFDDCLEMVGALMDESRSHGATLSYQTLAISHADTLWRLGRLAEARALLAEAAELADLVPTLAPLAWVGLAYNCHEQGAQEESSGWAARVGTTLVRGGEASYLRLWLCLMTCRNQLRAGRFVEAVEAADQASETARSSGILEPCIVPWHSAAIEAHVAAGNLELAAELVASLDEICQPLPCHAPRAVAAWGGALVAWRGGDLDLAEAGFERALAHNAKVAMPLAQAETLVAHGRFLRQTGRPSVARQTLHRALQVLEPTGAGRLQGIAQQELAGAGGRRRRAHAAGQLTAKEDQVARLAVQGLTNAQIAQAVFLATKTVDHHLSRAYAKLGVGSRRELMLVWREREASAGAAYAEGAVATAWANGAA